MRTETNLSPYSIKKSHWRWLIAILFFFQIPNFLPNNELKAQVGTPCIDITGFTYEASIVQTRKCA